MERLARRPRLQRRDDDCAGRRLSGVPCDADVVDSIADPMQVSRLTEEPINLDEHRGMMTLRSYKCRQRPG
jgi:hypothetical protein